mmetsp:Transcript_59252/g.158579  ORF Transcript_59252/g.158579 Transcript_59252/m.158579 type:complete len:398 (-) Transcript_59252:80-1273(-)
MADGVKKVPIACWLCRRKFQSKEQLAKHEKLSELHKKNLAAQVESFLDRKQAVVQEMQHQRPHVEANNPAYRSLESELGKIQSYLERQHLVSKGEVAPGEFELAVGDMMLVAKRSSWQGNKETQEDLAICEEVVCPGFQGAFFGVFDGHNGPRCAEYLVNKLVPAFRQILSTKARPCTSEIIKSALHESFILTDDDFLQLAFAHQMLDGSTAVCCVIWHDAARDRHVLFSAHVGDSRAVLQQKGKAIRLTEDHKPERDDERKRVVSAGGKVADFGGIWRVCTPHPVAFAGQTVTWALAVSRSFGDVPLKSPLTLMSAVPEVNYRDLCDDDSGIILACDGIFDVMSDQEVVDCANQNPRNDAEAVTRRSYEKQSGDNLTTLTVRFLRNGEKAPKRRKT